MDIHHKFVCLDAEFKLDEIDTKSALFFAAKNNHPSLVKRLSDAGLNLNITDDEGKTALFYANHNHSMDALLELIVCGAEFKLNKIDGKAILFFAAKKNYSDVVLKLHETGLDVDITDEQGKTIVFYGNKDFLDALMEVVADICLDARDHYGRTPLFYAVQDDAPDLKARYLIEKGANCHLKDNCNVSIFTMLAESLFSKDVETVDFSTFQLFPDHQKALTCALINILYCKAPLLSIADSNLLKTCTVFDKTKVLKAFAFIRHCLNEHAHKVQYIEKIEKLMIEEKEVDVLSILSLLMSLGANPQAADSDGNTALHHATILPLYGVRRAIVLDICWKLRSFGALLDEKNHQRESPLLFCFSSNRWCKVVTENSNCHSSISGFVEVCEFLLSNTNGLHNADSIFGRIISLVQLGLELSEDYSRKLVLKVLVSVLELFQPESEKAVRNVVKYIDSDLNSPLHLWATIALKSPQDYTRSLTEDFAFEKILRRILDHLRNCGANVNSRNVNNETPLHMCRTWTAVKLLLAAGANLNDQNSSGCSPLLAAAKKSNATRKTGHLYPDVSEDPESFWKYVLEKRLDPSIPDNKGETLFDVLSQPDSNFTLGKALFEVASNEKYEFKHTHTHLRGLQTKTTEIDTVLTASVNSDIRRVCELISSGSEFKLDEVDAKAVLFHVAKNNCSGVVDTLYDKKFDLNVTDDVGKTAVFYANRYHNIDTLCALIACDAEFNVEEIDGKAVLFHAAKNNVPVIVVKLHQKNFDLNITDNEGKTAVFYANRDNSMDALCALIGCGAEFNLDEIDAKSVLFHAAQYDYFLTVDKLNDKNFNLNITDDEGKTAVFYANRNNSMDALCKLIECYAEFKLDEIDAKSVLFHAAECNYSEIVDKLNDKNFNLNITDDEGKTAVFYANRYNRMDALCELIGCGAEFNLDEIDAKSVLFRAAQCDYGVTVDKLNDKNFNLNTTDDEGKTAVFYANRYNSMFALCELIDWGAEFNLDEIDAKSVLFHAAKEDYPVTVYELNDKSFDLNMTDDDGKTAVFYANYYKSMGALCALIEKGAEFNLDEIDAKSVLFHAAKEDYPVTVYELNDKSFDLNMTDDDGKTAVFYANYYKSMGALCALIEKGAEFNLDEIDAKSVLFHAAECNYSEIVDELNDKNFNLNITDDEGKTAVFYANRYNSMFALCALIDCGAEFNLDEIDAKSVWFHAAQYDYFLTLDELNDKNFNLNITDDEGKTAVFYANRNNSMDALCALIERGAEFNLDEIDAKSVLFHAAQYNYFLTVDRLNDKNFDVDITDDEGKTAVFYANRYNSMDALCALIGCGAEFNLDEIDAKSVLFHAAQYDYFLTLDELNNKNFNLNITDDEGKTAVFYANRNNSMDALCALIERGAEFNLDEIDAKSVLFHAAQYDYFLTVDKLNDKNFDVDITDDEGKTAVFYANRYNSMDALCELIGCGAEFNLDEIDAKFVLFHAAQYNYDVTVDKLQQAVFDILYCQAPLLSVRTFPHLMESYAIFNKRNVLEALAFAREQYVTKNSHKVGDIDEVVLMISGKNVMDVPRILSLLINLGADPQTTDSAGNTAFHYATLLPLYGVTQEVVMDICKKLRTFATIFHAKNHQGQSPLLFCFSPDTWKAATENNSWQSSIKGLVEVCRCFLCSRNVILNSEFIFHRIITLIQQGLELNAEVQRKAAVQTLVDVLELLQAGDEAVRKTVNYTDDFLNSPLHLWASIALKTFISQDYTIFGTEVFKFENIMKRILDHLLECGVHINARNVNDETPLHKCRTWTAVKLLLGAGANPNVQNSSGHSPLLATAKKKYASKKTGHLYPDITEEPESFWKCAIQKKLDPWVADKQEETILSVLIESEDFPLSRALVEVACKEESVGDDVKLLILRAICRDESKHTHWKTILVDIILNSAGTSHLALESPLRLCCQNMVKFGMFDDQQPVLFQATNDKPSEDDGQPPTKKARKDESEKEDEKKQESKDEQICNNSVYGKIAKHLRMYVSDTVIESIANDYPSVKDVLMKPIVIDSIPECIPWTSVCVKHKTKLGKVAGKQETLSAGEISYHKEKVGTGSFGSIFAGINTRDGEEVAVKRMDKSRLKPREVKREIENLVRLRSDHIVRYISSFEDKFFLFVVLELMEGNLREFFDGNIIDTEEAIRFCKDVVMGVQFIHNEGILHRDLKPENILYTAHPQRRLKIADFGLSRDDDTSKSMTRTLHGTRCWMAPEVLTPVPNSDEKSRFVAASDVYSCGLLLHYILSQKHPFAPKNCTSEFQVPHKTEANIMNGKMEGWDKSLCPEATHLIKRMLIKSNENDRPSAAEALQHPFFWSNKEKVDFLEVVGNQKEFACPRSKRHHHSSSTQVEQDLEKRFSIIVKHKDWSSLPDMNKLYCEMKRRRKYKTSSAVELVRFIRNTYVHYQDNTFPTPKPIEQMLFDDFVFLKCFPDLVIEVYKAVTTHDWDKKRDDIKCFLNNIRIR